MNNYHLLFVHFPIALLMLYAGLEIISVKRLHLLPYWFYIKAVLVVVGSAAAFVTLQTGDLIEGQFKFIRNVVEMHSLWADITTGIFTGLAVLYLVQWIRTMRANTAFSSPLLNTVWSVVLLVHTALYRRPIVCLFAVAGLIAVSVTGALGGSIAHGPDTDPLASFVYHLFF